MSLLNFFKGENKTQVTRYSKLYDRLSSEYKDLSEKELVIASCVAGLLARVAYVDFNLDPNESKEIERVLSQWKFNFSIDSKHVSQMAIKHIKDMAGLENHLYVHPLKEILSKEERYSILQSLFLVAASDGSVESIESEEIRLIAKGLELSNQHFIAARAEVSEFLKSLQ